MIHQVTQEKLTVIMEMDRKIGEFMQKRSDYVNSLIYQQAELAAGDAVRCYDQQRTFLFEGTVVQPLFLKREGIITYRIRRQDGEVFTNTNLLLERASEPSASR